jgi:uncharacterized membrane protein
MKAYQAAHQTRASWYHLQWRIFAVLASAAAIGIIYNYLFFKYTLYLPEYGAFLGDRFFYWFMLGTLFGIVSLAAVFEGEFILGVKRVTKEIESEAHKELGRPAARKRRRK